MSFQVNQIVKGKIAGHFVILALRNVGGEQGAQVKPVNPKNYAEHGAGEFFMPLDLLEMINADDCRCSADYRQ